MSFKNHFRPVHRGISDFCFLCGYESASVWKLNNHIENRYSLENIFFFKSVVGIHRPNLYKLNQKRLSLYNHLGLVHWGFRDYCAFCRYKSASLWKLKRHVENVYSNHVLISVAWARSMWPYIWGTTVMMNWARLRMPLSELKVSWHLHFMHV